MEAGVGPRATTVDVKDTTVPGETLEIGAGDTQLLGSLGAGYRWESGNMVLGAGAFWNPAGKDAGHETFTDAFGTSTIELEQKNHWGIGVEAGWKLAAPTTLYAKVAWHRAKFEGTLAADGFSESRSKNFDGWGYGLGLRHSVNNNLYVFAEWQQVEFEDQEIAEGINLDPRNTIGLIGVGYRF